MLLRELRGRMRAAMIDAGWQEGATTHEGQPIYQYRPAPWLSGEEIDEVAAAFVTQGDQAGDLEDQAGSISRKSTKSMAPGPKSMARPTHVGSLPGRSRSVAQSGFFCISPRNDVHRFGGICKKNQVRLTLLEAVQTAGFLLGSG